MKLELNDVEAQELATALANHLVGLRQELTHTDDRTAHREFVAIVRRLEAIAQRLEESLRVSRAADRPNISM